KEFGLLMRGRKMMIGDTQHQAQLPAVGTRAQRIRTISEIDLVAFAQVSGDHNPLHLDPQSAAQTPFGGRIAHGFLTASLISAIVGTELPGPGSIYLGQTLKFLAPVRVGDT